MGKVRGGQAKCMQDLDHSFLVDTINNQHFYKCFDQHDRDKVVVFPPGSSLHLAKMGLSYFRGLMKY